MTHPKQAENLELETVDDELIVLDTASGHVHKLNGTAAQVFNACDGKTPVDAIVDTLLETYDVPRSQAAADVAQVLDVFAEQGLVTNSG